MRPAWVEPPNARSPVSSSKRDRAGREDVGSTIAAITASLLGGHVARRAERSTGNRIAEGAALALESRQAKIEDSERAPAVDDQILRFEVAVEDSTGVSSGEAASELEPEGDSSRPRQLASLEDAAKRLALDQLRDDEVDAIVGADVVDRHHVRVLGLQRRRVPPLRGDGRDLRSRRDRARRS